MERDDDQSGVHLSKDFSEGVYNSYGSISKLNLADNSIRTLSHRAFAMFGAHLIKVQRWWFCRRSMPTKHGPSARQCERDAAVLCRPSLLRREQWVPFGGGKGVVMARAARTLSVCAAPKLTPTETTQVDLARNLLDGGALRALRAAALPHLERLFLQQNAIEARERSDSLFAISACAGSKAPSIARRRHPSPAVAGVRASRPRASGCATAVGSWRAPEHAKRLDRRPPRVTPAAASCLVSLTSRRRAHSSPADDDDDDDPILPDGTSPSSTTRRRRLAAGRARCSPRRIDHA